MSISFNRVSSHCLWLLDLLLCASDLHAQASPSWLLQFSPILPWVSHLCFYLPVSSLMLKLTLFSEQALICNGSQIKFQGEDPVFPSPCCFSQKLTFSLVVQGTHVDTEICQARDVQGHGLLDLYLFGFFFLVFFPSLIKVQLSNKIVYI